MKRLSDSIVVAIPAMDEAAWLPGTLNSLAAQTIQGFQVVVCVNQPDPWWDDPVRVATCHNNRSTMEWLSSHRKQFPFKVHILNRTSRGMGWPHEKGGAGLARRVVMDEAARHIPPEGVIVSADADAMYESGYLEAIAHRMAAYPGSVALAAPYYHPLTNNTEHNRAMLMYELYMRFHLLNLMRIGSPYAFTAIGSAMAVTRVAYQKVGGVPLKPFGEDFYLLQKLAKTGKVLTHLHAKALPAARVSNRVAFGTGPAITESLAGNKPRYQILHPNLYEPIGQLYQMLPALFSKNQSTPLDDKIAATFKQPSIWEPLRNNAKTTETFLKACHQKLDALRTWQWLRQGATHYDPDEALLANLQLFLPDIHKQLSGSMPDYSQLVEIRDRLCQVECIKRKAYDEEN